LIEHLLELRGLGILNIMTLFGAGAVKNYKRISYVVQLELWDDKKQYERLGIEEDTMKIMDVHVPKAIVPVRPGRNLAVIIEVAAMNVRLKRMGVNAAEEFSQQLATMMKNNNEQKDVGVIMLMCEAEPLNRVFLEIGFLSIYWYGVIIATGLFLGLYLATKESERLGLQKDIMIDLVVFAAPIAILFARIYYVIFEFDAYRGQPWWKFIAVWEGGIAIHGALIGAVLTGIV